LSEQRQKVSISRAKTEDIKSISELVIRLKKLNEEFDPLLKVREDALGRAQEEYRECVENPECVVLVAKKGDKVVGVVKAKTRERVYYQPRIEGAIIDFYVMPEYRRQKLGEQMIAEVISQLKRKGAGIIVAEFPFQNKIASTFYQKLGFRPVIGIFGKPD
jgi:ribosomal protein S18 acetylase RimI-like enzyme